MVGLLLSVCLSVCLFACHLFNTYGSFDLYNLHPSPLSPFPRPLLSLYLPSGFSLILDRQAAIPALLRTIEADQGPGTDEVALPDEAGDIDIEGAIEAGLGEEAHDALEGADEAEHGGPVFLEDVETDIARLPGHVGVADGRDEADGRRRHGVVGRQRERDQPPPRVVPRCRRQRVPREDRRQLEDVRWRCRRERHDRGRGRAVVCRELGDDALGGGAGGGRGGG
jgi:hypothetical protein